MVCGDGACLGCGEKGTIHLFTSTVTALMQPRVKKYLSKLDTLIGQLENHLRMKLSSTVNLTDTHALLQAVQANQGRTLSGETVKFGSNGEFAWQLSRFTGGVTAPSGHTLRVLQRQPDGGLRVLAQVSVPDAPAQQ